MRYLLAILTALILATGGTAGLADDARGGEQKIPEGKTPTGKENKTGGSEEPECE